MSVAPAFTPGQPMSWEEYARLDSSPPSEYIDGCLVMSPTPTRGHQQICMRLANDLATVVPSDHEVTLAWAWKPGRDEFAPDVMVHPRTDEQVRFTGTPLLVVEVLSSNRADDLVIKSGKYAAAGAPHYWIVDARDRVLNAYTLREGLYQPVAQVTETEKTPVPFGESTLMVDLPVLLG